MTPIATYGTRNDDIITMAPYPEIPGTYIVTINDKPIHDLTGLSERAAALHVLLLGPIFNKLTPDTQNTVIAELTD